MPIALITLVIQDADADTSPVSVFVSVETSDTVESLETDYAHVLWDAIRPLITGVLVRVEIAIRPDISAWTNNTLDTTSDIQEKVRFTLRPCGNGRLVRLSLPTVDEGILVNAGRGKIVDTTNTDVQVFYAVVQNGVVDDGIGMVDSHGFDICEVLTGEQFFGKG